MGDKMENLLDGDVYDAYEFLCVAKALMSKLVQIKEPIPPALQDSVDWVEKQYQEEIAKLRRLHHGE